MLTGVRGVEQEGTRKLRMLKGFLILNILERKAGQGAFRQLISGMVNDALAGSEKMKKLSHTKFLKLLHRKTGYDARGVDDYWMCEDERMRERGTGRSAREGLTRGAVQPLPRVCPHGRQLLPEQEEEHDRGRRQGRAVHLAHPAAQGTAVALLPSLPPSLPPSSLGSPPHAGARLLLPCPGTAGHSAARAGRDL